MTTLEDLRKRLLYLQTRRTRICNRAMQAHSSGDSYAEYWSLELIDELDYHIDEVEALIFLADGNRLEKGVNQ